MKNNFHKYLMIWFLACIGVLPAIAFDIQRLQINGSAAFGLHREFGPANAEKNRLEWGVEDWDLLLNLEMGEHTRLSTDISWESDELTDTAQGQFRLAYGFIEHAFADEVKLRLGKFFIPFGANNTLRRAGLATVGVDIPLSTIEPNRYVDDAFPFIPSTGHGALLQGEVVFDEDKILEYDLGVSLGLQDSLYIGEARDGNDSKALTTRLKIEIDSRWKGEKSFYFDWISGARYGFMFSDGYGVSYTGDVWTLQAEFVNGLLEDEKADNINKRLVQKAAFFQSSWTLAGYFTPYLRVEWIDPPGKGTSNGLTVPTFGTQWDLGAWYTLKVEVTSFSFVTESASANEQSYTKLSILFLAGF